MKMKIAVAIFIKYSLLLGQLYRIGVTNTFIDFICLNIETHTNTTLLMQWQSLNDIGVSNIICKTIISLFTPVCRCQRIVSFYKIYTSNDGQNQKLKKKRSK